MPLISTLSSKSLNGIGVGLPPTYSFGINPSSINEGGSETFTVNTTNVSNGAVLYWSVQNQTTFLTDFESFNGSFTITNNTGSFNISAKADLFTEGEKTFTILIKTGSQTGPTVLNSTPITINDTSTNVTSVTSFYGNQGLSVTVNSSRLNRIRPTPSTKFGTRVLSGTGSNSTGVGTAGRANAVNIPLNPSVTVPLTLEAWVYCNDGYTSPDFATTPPIYLHGPNDIDIATTNPTNSIRLFGVPQNSFGISFQDQVVQNNLVISGSNDSGLYSIPISTWTHMAMVITSTQLAIWVGGVRRELRSLTTFNSTMNYLTLNAFGAGSVNNYIDEIRISNIARYGPGSPSITVPTSQFTSDSFTVALVKFEA